MAQATGKSTSCEKARRIRRLWYAHQFDALDSGRFRDLILGRSLTLSLTLPWLTLEPHTTERRTGQRLIYVVLRSHSRVFRRCPPVDGVGSERRGATMRPAGRTSYNLLEGIHGLRRLCEGILDTPLTRHSLGHTANTRRAAHEMRHYCRPATSSTTNTCKGTLSTTRFRPGNRII